MPQIIKEDQSSNSASSVLLQGLGVLLFIPTLVITAALLVVAIAALVAFGLIGFAVGFVTTLIQCVTCNCLDLHIGEKVVDLGKNIYKGLVFGANGVLETDLNLIRGRGNSNLGNSEAQLSDPRSNVQESDFLGILAVFDNINHIISDHPNYQHPETHGEDDNILLSIHHHPPPHIQATSASHSDGIHNQGHHLQN